ncbi:MAG: Gfo/Idh/MocA family oxidoreductase, partial [Fusobacterium sp.]
FANKVASELGVSAVTNDSEIFSNTDIDAILIASPTDTHIEFIEKLIFLIQAEYFRRN